MAQMHKNAKPQKKRNKHYTNEEVFLQNRKKQTETEIFAFCVITFEPIKI